MFGRTQAVVAREKLNIERDIRSEEREYQKIYTDFLVLIEEVNTQADKIDVIRANIKDNAKEKAIHRINPTENPINKIATSATPISSLFKLK